MITKHRLTFELTPQQRKTFLSKRGAAGHVDTSKFIIELLNLNKKKVRA